MRNIYGRNKVRKREKSNKKIEGEKNKGKWRRKNKKQDP